MALKVKETTFSARDTLRITSATDAVPMKDVPDGTELHYIGYVKTEITNESTGEIFDSIVIKTEDGSLYATRSASFMRALEEILETIADFGEDDLEPIILTVKHLKSKNGNTFVTCQLA